MRPACIRNARSLASQPSPLLPLLAPRAFAAARNRTGQDDCRSQKEQEEKRWNETKKVADARAGDGTSIGARYVDIFSFARQQLRSYSTSVEAASADGSRRRGRRHPHKERSRNGHASGSLKVEQPKETAGAPPIRKTVSVRGKLQARSATAVKRFSERTVPEVGGPSRLEKQQKLSIISDSRRRRKLASLRKTLNYFETYEAPNFPDLQLSDHGKYRSLQRQILALLWSERQEVDFSKPYDSARGTQRRLRGMAFAALDRRVFAGLKRRSHPLVLRHHEKCAAWTADLFDEGRVGAEDVWERWATFDSDTREQYWPHILIYVLDEMPHRALPFLQALTHQPCVKSLDVKLITDAFHYLARLYLNKGVWSPTQVKDLRMSKLDFVPTFYHVFKEHFALHKRTCPQDLLFTLAKLASIEDLRRVFDLFKECDVYMGYNTLLHYANAFAEVGDFNQGLMCLQIIADGAPNPVVRDQLVNEPKFKWTCALVLHRSMLNPEGYHETTRIVGAFVDLGVKLDILLYNVVMRNAMEASDYSTAFKVFNTLEENALKPDKHTFSTLLRGCTTLSDPSKFEDFAKYSAETAREMRDPWLAADYLYYRYVRLYRESSSPEESIGRSYEMMKTYLEYFSPEPLQPFAAEHIRYFQAARDDAAHEPLSMEPPPMALYLMLQLEILKASKAETSQVWPLYQRFTQLVHENSLPSISNLARNPIIWNAFLLSFCRANNFPQASQLVHDMPEHGVQPNIYTWNIFMQAFFKDRQIRAAERVYKIMRARGIEPDQFTYEVLLRGYARSQQVNKIGGIIEHVSEERQESPKLLRALARVHDQERLVYQLEQARVQKERKESERAKEKEEEERARWAPPKFESMFESLVKTKEGGEGAGLGPLTGQRGTSGMSFGSLVKK